MKKHIIFDMDGVLVDSEPVHMKILNEVLVTMGASAVSLEYYFSLVGMGGRLIWEKLIQDFKLKGLAPDLYASHKEYFYNVIETHDVQPVKGVVQFLNRLKKENYFISLGSSSPVRLINHSISKIGVKDYFDYLVSSEHVQNGKPFPDIFLKVAELYKVKPLNFLVIEDSHNGVLAAKAAGMTCIGYKNPNSGNQDLTKADIIISHFDELSDDVLRDLH